MMDNRKDVTKILDYWYTLEFLAQNNYPSYQKTQRDIEEFKNKLSKGKLKKIYPQKTFLCLSHVVEKDDLYDLISNEAIACHMKKWSNITIYIGNVKRETCIERIAENLPRKNDEIKRPEKNRDSIAWMSLQLNPDGTYRKGTLSLSPIIWALNRINNNTNSDLSNLLNTSEYDKTVENLESKFFDLDDVNPVDDIEEDMQKFSTSCVSLSKLQALSSEIQKIYLTNNIPLPEDYQEMYGISYVMYPTQKEKDKAEEEQYLGLNRSFYSSDLRMLLDLSKRNALDKDIVRYILSPLEKNHKHRTDIVHPENRNTYHQMLFDILDVANAPIGKWPSPYRPAFMQQVAINLVCGKQKEIYKQNIFSVNGPPGTGKTTLLKEIVVNNIVERAILLSKYDDPNDAFIEQNFLHGDKPEHAYSQYVKHYYKLKDDAINDYSILVASNNNAAVENISKELPKEIAENLRKSCTDTESGKLLCEVADLFDVEVSGNIEEIKDKKGSESLKDIYFSRQAKQLLDANKNKKDKDKHVVKESNDNKAWGLVAAPLGNKQNIQNFYTCVLEDIIFNYYKKDSKSQEIRKERYLQARDAFKKQLQIVKQLRFQINDTSDLVKECWKERNAVSSYTQKVKESTSAFEKICMVSKVEQNRLYEQLQPLKQKEKEQTILLEHLQQEQQQGNKELQDINARISFANKKQQEVLSTCNVFVKLFQKQKYLQVLQEASSYHDTAVTLNQEGKNKAVTLSNLKYEVQKQQQILSALKEQIREINQKIESYHKKVQDASSTKQKAIDNETKAKENYQKCQKEVQERLQKHGESSSLDQMTILDDDFVQALLSEDEEVSTKAHILNPWFTERYDREREKLFAYAIRLNKEFVLSSDNCKHNLMTLGNYWGVKLEDKKKILFHIEDKEKMVPALYQTLFLIVPVISTTFAALGTMFKDVKQPNVIGMLVVDEAGQALPQIALGGLYRSRKAVIVGDPKQVEPVETEDLALLKNAYQDDDLVYYNDTSVQVFADRINMFGTNLDAENDWVGCPLLVHRRCISPMYDISNCISYNNIMKQQTPSPSKEDRKKFIYDTSQWIHVEGKERGNKNHFVQTQGEEVCKLLEIAFTKNEKPDIFIISPFTTVIHDIIDYIKKYVYTHPETKIDKDYLLNEDAKRIGTVHTFQGKEANEVIFLLGCDASSGSIGAVQWVNANIVNVAVTRAKYRLYVIGDRHAWSMNRYLKKVQQFLDTYIVKEIKKIHDADISQDKKDVVYKQLSTSLPALTNFTKQQIDEEGEEEYLVETDHIVQGLSKDFQTTKLTREQLQRFGFQSEEELNNISMEVRNNLILGMKLYFLLEPIYALNPKMDASCCGILFCKALELHVQDCFKKSLKATFPTFLIKGMGKNRSKVQLKDARDKELTLGAFDTIIKKNIESLSMKMLEHGYTQYDQNYWLQFEQQLNQCTNKRNHCCHSGLFEWSALLSLQQHMFLTNKDSQINGLIFACEAGKKI